ncbi:TPA: hypothetical protein DEP94_02210 [Candidatus Nomurabacteria bacterium]|nr:hypothetical protein [Candidatus Nomurabacteria bacterium]
MKKLFLGLSFLLGIVGILLTSFSLYSLFFYTKDGVDLFYGCFILFWGIVSIACSFVFFKSGQRI